MVVRGDLRRRHEAGAHHVGHRPLVEPWGTRRGRGGCTHNPHDRTFDTFSLHGENTVAGTQEMDSGARLREPREKAVPWNATCWTAVVAYL